MKLKAIFSRSGHDVMGTVWAWSLALLLPFSVRPCHSVRRRCVVEDGIKHCLISCNRTHASCPTWMYCDYQTTKNCVPCTICQDDDFIPRDRKQCADEPVRCESTMGSSLSDLLCPQLRAVNTSVCSGYCHSGSTRYLSPLGTACVITCNYGNGRPVQTYSRTCVWENDVIGGVHAAWKPDYLPDGITNVNTDTTTTAATGTDTTTASPSVGSLWTIVVVVVVVVVLVMCCVVVVACSVVVLRRFAYQTLQQRRPIDDVDDSDKVESVAASSGSSSSDAEACRPEDSKRCLTATEHSDDEDLTSGIATQPSSSVNVRDPPRQFSFSFSREFPSLSLHSDDFAPPVDDGRRGNRHHDDDAATPARGGVCDSDNIAPVERPADSRRWFDVSLGPEETRCKLLLSG